jgi:hypothetical protein
LLHFIYKEIGIELVNDQNSLSAKNPDGFLNLFLLLPAIWRSHAPFFAFYLAMETLGGKRVLRIRFFQSILFFFDKKLLLLINGN